MHCLSLLCLTHVIFLAREASGHQGTRTLNVRFVSWTDNAPYYIPNHVRSTNGMVPQAIKYHFREYIEPMEDDKRDIRLNLIDEPPKYLETQQQLFDFVEETNLTKVLHNLNTTLQSPDVYIVSPTTKWKSCKYFHKLSVLETEEAAVIVRTADILLLLRFFAGIGQCMGVIFFAIVCALNLAAIIWLIERNSNEDFQNTFGAGLWTSFWYCFVTMTTVGYGDKVPKNFVTRILCLVWMLFGLMLTAIITATVIEAVQNDFPKVNQKIAVSQSSLEESIVINKLAGVPIRYKDYHAILSAIRNKEVVAGLLDINVAAYVFKKYNIKDLTIESKQPMRKSMYAYVYHNPEITKIKFYFDDVTRNLPAAESLRVRAIYVPAYKEQHYYARPFEELFDRQDGGLVFYLTILGGCMIFLGIISEIVSKVWTKRNKKKSSSRTNSNTENGCKDLPEYRALEEIEKALNAKVERMKAEINKKLKRKKHNNNNNNVDNSTSFTSEI